MTPIIEKRHLGQEVKLLVLSAPELARKAQPGQFVIVRTAEESERIPMTIADMDPDAGTITIVVQALGVSSRQLAACEPGESVTDLAGPLGKPSRIEQFGTVASVGGGIGIAAVFPIARALARAGNRVVSILGARTADLLFWEEETAGFSEVHIATDDGSRGRKGLVTDELSGLISSGVRFDYVLAIGPTVMMRAVAGLTRSHHIPTTVSLNPIMVDGTGMCGGCRVTIGGKTAFACVDGPEFDAHEVDFGELLTRQKAYAHEERCALDRWMKR